MAGYWPRMRPISSHLDRTILVNKGFITWLHLQVKLRQQNKTEHGTVLLGKKFFIAGWYKVHFQCIFGLACYCGKQGILNYLKALIYSGLKGVYNY